MRAAGYSSRLEKENDDNRVFRNLPGFSNPPPGYINPLQALAANRARSSTLTYKDGRAIAVDVVRPIPAIPAVSLADPLNTSRYNKLPGTQPTLELLSTAEAIAAYPETTAQAAAAGMLRAKAETEANSSISAAGGGVGYMHMRAGAKTPGWLLYDGKVLRFAVSWPERVQYNATMEEYRIHRGQLRYYLEDDTLEVVEAQEDNNGLAHGKFLHRSRVFLADGSPLRWDQLRVGQELTVYSRRFTLAACDGATRQWLEAHGVLQAGDQAMPEGDYDVRKKELDQFNRMPRPPPIGDERRGPSAVFNFQAEPSADAKLRGNKVLRFYCCWDDTGRMFGQKLPFALHYFLSDDTIEVVEVHLRNCGRDPFPLLLKRCKLPKTLPPVGGRPLSPATLRAHAIKYYQWQDLAVGGVVKVYNRDLFIYAVDKATKQWYKERLGVPDYQMQPIAVEFDTSVKRPELLIPPNVGNVGSDEDSLRNVLHLMPRAPPSDYNTFLANWNKVFRFSARMVAWDPTYPLPHAQDEQRRFVVSYHLLDQTIAIWEVCGPNTGLKGGAFLERTRVKRHGAPPSIVAECYDDSDFQIGTTLVIFSRGFQLLDADEATLNYQEQETGRYPWAKYEWVLAKLQHALAEEPGRVAALRSELLRRDALGSGYITQRDLHAALVAAGMGVGPHEAVTLVRRLGADRQGVVMVQLLEALGVLDDDDDDIGAGRRDARAASGAGGPPRRAAADEGGDNAPPYDRWAAESSSKTSSSSSGRADERGDAAGGSEDGEQRQAPGDAGSDDRRPWAAPRNDAGQPVEWVQRDQRIERSDPSVVPVVPLAGRSDVTLVPPSSLSPSQLPAREYLNRRNAAVGIVPGLLVPIAPARIHAAGSAIPLYATPAPLLTPSQRAAAAISVLPVATAAAPFPGAPYRRQPGVPLPTAPIELQPAPLTGWSEAVPVAVARPAAGVPTRRPPPVSVASTAPFAVYSVGPDRPRAVSDGGVWPVASGVVSGALGNGRAWQARDLNAAAAAAPLAPSAPSGFGSSISSGPGSASAASVPYPQQQYYERPTSSEQLQHARDLAADAAALLDVEAGAAARAAQRQVFIDQAMRQQQRGAVQPVEVPLVRNVPLTVPTTTAYVARPAVVVSGRDPRFTAVPGSIGYVPPPPPTVLLDRPGVVSVVDSAPLPSAVQWAPVRAATPPPQSYLTGAAAAAASRAADDVAAVADEALRRQQQQDDEQQYLTGGVLDDIAEQQQGSSVAAAAAVPLAAAAALGVAAAPRFARPSALWRTTNQASGGVHARAQQRQPSTIDRHVSFK